MWHAVQIHVECNDREPKTTIWIYQIVLNAVLTMTNDSSKLSATYCTTMLNKLNQNVRRLDNLPGLECLHLQEKWCNMPTKSTAAGRIMSLPNPMNLMRMPLHELNRTKKMPTPRSMTSKSDQRRSMKLTYNSKLKHKQRKWTQLLPTPSKAILKQERDAGIFPLLCQWINRPQNRSLDELLTPGNPLDIKNTMWTAIVEKQAIFEALIKNGQEHFSQASDTPFVNGPVAKLIGPFDFNEYSQQILCGKFDIDLMSDDIQLAMSNH